MSKFFIGLYNYFQRHQFFFYFTLIGSVAIMGFFAAQVKFDENISSFFPDNPNSANTRTVFNNLKIKDKIILMLSASDPLSPASDDQLSEAAEMLYKRLTEEAGATLIKDIFYKVDGEMIGNVNQFIYDNLPLFLTEEDYHRLDSVITPEGIRERMAANYSNLLSPAGMALREFITRDPLGLGNHTLRNLQEMQVEGDYELIGEHLYSADGTTLLMILSPVYGTGSTGKNDELINVIETETARLQNRYPEIKAEYFGGPSVGVYNARQIKKDTMLTLSVALTIIIIFISLVFKRKSSIPLIITPVLFGFVFSLFLIYFIKGTISAIAIGAGSVVFGIALSYSIHMLAHQNHVSSVPQLIRELAYPLTVGSFTTIGAFFALVFTSSDLLRDFGLFASFALIGTTLFCLVWLPHFLKGQADVKQGKVLRIIERINAYPYDKNKWIVGSIIILTIVCLYTSQWVGFNEDMMGLHYEPHHLKAAEQKLTGLFDNEERAVPFVTVGATPETALENYRNTNRKLAELAEKGMIAGYASAEKFIVTPQEQQRRLERWNTYWNPEKTELIRSELETEATNYRFKPGTFNAFYDKLEKEHTSFVNQEEETPAFDRIFSDWQVTTPEATLLISQVRIKEQTKEAVYEAFGEEKEVVIFDRGYFTNKWVSAVNDDFYLILYLSSFLIFVALWISFGRIELALMSFLPMLVSWIIILGIMGILGIEFNIINIILSTFIFGIGDDFSIFIMDGLQNKYRTGKRVLDSHKTAIFFSAFTTVIGMGALVFAKHPALQSISLISILGMMAVVLVAYTIQPVIYKIFIIRPGQQGLPPYTLTGLLRTGIFFLIFMVGCLLIRLMMLLLYLIPIRKTAKQQAVCKTMSSCCRLLLNISPFVKKEVVNPYSERFKKPAIAIANHQSFLDIVVLLSLSSKMVMVTNHWVSYSPFFGAIIRYAGFFCVDEGYENYLEKMKSKVAEGYSIAVFPEGTRTRTEAMKRFHKGAFYLAEQLDLDIIPVIFYGNGMVISKSQPFNIRKGIMATVILPRITPEDKQFGTTYQERTKLISRYMKREYAEVRDTYHTPDNPWFYESLVQNYIYKGPVEEWYIRVKVKMENNYQLFNNLIAKEGKITDIGCGYGALCYMLSMVSDKREITGIDYDEDKIAVAQHGWLRNKQLQFVHGNALDMEYPESDYFILNDMLHYMDHGKQFTLLQKCALQLKEGGSIIVRDGNSSDEKHHRVTRFTELLSTRVFRFNKTSSELCFLSEKQMTEIARKLGMKINTMRNDKYTSNTIYLLRKQ